MKILSIEQIKAWDEFTIKNEPISSIDLMERAANSCIRHIIKDIPLETEFVIFCGKGNNGGDGLSITRQLLLRGFSAKAIVVNYTENSSADFKINLERLIEFKQECISYIDKEEQLKKIILDDSTIIIDALLGTGVNKRIEGLLASTVNFINNSHKKIISIDIPSGLYTDTENHRDDVIVRSSLTLTFQLPKLSFLFAQNQDFVQQFEVLDIGLSLDFLAKQHTPYYFTSKKDIQPLLKYRGKFSHKGKYGHALLIAGSYGKMGAAVIAAKACLRSGAGLLTVHVPQKGVDVLQSSIPEAMVSIDKNEKVITETPKLDIFHAVGIGPGIGTEVDTESVLKHLFNFSSQPMVIDADGLNALSKNKTWLAFLPPNTILTPHVKEFDRLTNTHESDFERLKSAKEFSLKYNCIVVLKSAFTQIVMPDGNTFFNSTGNAGLAKGGSGDTLTGIILGLLARGYNAPQAALIGVYVHGLSADICLKKINMESLLASDVIEKLPKAFDKMYKIK